MNILYSPQFARKYKKLPSTVKQQAIKQEKIFRKNPRDKRLKTHKLKGRLSKFWSFSIGYKYRIIFEFKKSDKVYFHTIGDHRIYEE
jgi:toxin HigB-1